ncbi:MULTISPECIES: hypothetical protein [unclassified Mannheimia]|uniref:hypothetical protein n=1 Tax=unclassified Mannheimia TaxID=2645054 RepID=UPI00359EED9D
MLSLNRNLFDFSKKKKIILFAFFLILILVVRMCSSSADEKKTFVELDAKYDFINDSTCEVITYQNGSLTDKEFDNIYHLYLPKDIKINETVKIPFEKIKKFSEINLDDKEVLYSSEVWHSYIENSNFSELEKAAFLRNKKLPAEFVNLVEFSKEYMNKLYNIDKLTFYNWIRNAHYDPINERLVLSLSDLDFKIENFTYGKLPAIEHRYIGIDIPFNEMKKITENPSEVQVAINLQLQQSEKGSAESRTVYEIKTISSQIKVFAEHMREGKYSFVLEPNCGKYKRYGIIGEDDKRYVPISKGELGTLKVKNPRVCHTSHVDDKKCKDLTISNSF